MNCLTEWKINEEDTGSELNSEYSKTHFLTTEEAMPGHGKGASPVKKQTEPGKTNTTQWFRAAPDKVRAVMRRPRD